SWLGVHFDRTRERFMDGAARLNFAACWRGVSFIVIGGWGRQRWRSLRAGSAQDGTGLREQQLANARRAIGGLARVRKRQAQSADRKRGRRDCENVSSTHRQNSYHARVVVGRTTDCC